MRQRVSAGLPHFGRSAEGDYRQLPAFGELRLFPAPAGVAGAGSGVRGAGDSPSR